MPQSNEKVSFANQLGGFAIASGLGSLFHSLDVRIAHYDKACDPAIPEFESPCIWLFWHEYILAPLASWHSLDVTMLVSKHRDANLLTHAANRLGLTSVQGSTNKGGAEAIRQLKKLRNTPGIAITPDGPRGPRREMALGPIYLASRLGLPIVPTGFGFEHPIRMNSWDRFAIPKPGTRCRMVMGEKIHIARKAGREELEQQRLFVQNTLNELTTTAEQWAESKNRVEGEMIFHRRPNRNWRTGELMTSLAKNAAESAGDSRDSNLKIERNTIDSVRRAA